MRSYLTLCDTSNHSDNCPINGLLIPRVTKLADLANHTKWLENPISNKVIRNLPRLTEINSFSKSTEHKITIDVEPSHCQLSFLRCVAIKTKACLLFWFTVILFAEFVMVVMMVLLWDIFTKRGRTQTLSDICQQKNCYSIALLWQILIFFSWEVHVYQLSVLIIML